jgi:hypothetical protein
VPFTTQQLRNIGVLTAQLYNETDTTLQCTFQTSCSLTHICNCNVPLSSVASYCTDSTTHKEVTCSAHTTKNANPQMITTHTNDRNSHMFHTGKSQGLNKYRYNIQWPRNIWHCCTTPATIPSRDIIQRATSLWGTWESLSFLAPTVFVLCCTRKQHQAEGSHVDQSVGSLFPLKFFHQVHIFCSKDLSRSTTTAYGYYPCFCNFGTTLLHAKFLYST